MGLFAAGQGQDRPAMSLVKSCSSASSSRSAGGVPGQPGGLMACIPALTMETA